MTARIRQVGKVWRRAENEAVARFDRPADQPRCRPPVERTAWASPRALAMQRRRPGETP